VIATQVQTLRRSHHFLANREKVFRAWTDPQELKKWWGPGRYTTAWVEIDLRPGGQYRIAMQPPQGPLEYLFGTYVEVVAPERLVMTWTSQGSPRDDGHESLLTIEFIARGRETEVVLTHERLPVASTGAYDSGWSSTLDHLQAHFSPAP
jgi:uncharacterized protein YndB with AHSA1/START domain